ncbi:MULTISPECIES: FFLEELY motif protein [unclassified Psychrobacter]|uniref:FFLEELY motif protein n=1 Tax=unclassified Psychrobacter TaxID=196806 RepID=UPI003FD41126
MTAFLELQQHLTRYWALPYHDDENLSEMLAQVQAWQRIRIRNTHKELFEQPKHQPMANYFLTQLYGGEEFKLLAVQLARILPKAQKLERMIKESVLETGSMAIQAAVLAIEMDLHLAQWLDDRNMPVNEKNIMIAYSASDKSDERRDQISNLKEVCYRSDKYFNSFFLQKAFKLAKSTAYNNNYQPLYDFVEAGFDAMGPLESVSSFIEPFCTRELMIIDQIQKARGDKLARSGVS